MSFFKKKHFLKNSARNKALRRQILLNSVIASICVIFTNYLNFQNLRPPDIIFSSITCLRPKPEIREDLSIGRGEWSFGTEILSFDCLLPRSELEPFRLRFPINSPGRRHFSPPFHRRQAEARVCLNRALCLSLLVLTL